MDDFDALIDPSPIAPSEDWSVYKTLLESTKAIPWKIDWESKRFAYIGPQIERVLGWSQDSWLSAADWIERIHPEDRQRTADFCICQSELGTDHEADYRALRADGGYVWIRDVVHVIRDDAGVTTSLVGFMFDISERKQLEDELHALNRKLAVWSHQDGLTGAANRRLFDQTIAAEWATAQRDGTALSLVVFDFDHFKLYNDHFGHLKGDECLIRMADAVQALDLPTDALFARYGGEEFVLLLPRTSAEDAALIAERCRAAVEALRIDHAPGASNRLVTISVGVSTEVPAEGAMFQRLIERADAQLYLAKQCGRNCVRAG